MFLFHAEDVVCGRKLGPNDPHSLKHCFQQGRARERTCNPICSIHCFNYCLQMLIMGLEENVCSGQQRARKQVYSGFCCIMGSHSNN